MHGAAPVAANDGGSRYLGTPGPRSVFRPPDLDRARANLESPWGETLLSALLARVEPYIAADAAWIEAMIPATTPGATIFTLCPRCETAPFHGNWDWSPAAPDRIVCRGCGTAFPNAAFPEEIELASGWDSRQRFTYHGKSRPAFGFKALHSSFSGHIRARKVAFAAALCQDAAMAFALTGQARYGRLAARLLVRFSEVYPRYLVHSGYGEYADGRPDEAIRAVHEETAIKLTPPDNPQDGRIFPGYWMLGRATAGGMEGAFLHQVALAYDLLLSAPETAGGSPPLLTAGERARIERDLLLEGARFVIWDPRLNNKTTTNRSAAAMIGAILGRRHLVVWGLSGFVRAVCEWNAPDGATGESFGYNLMVWHGLWRVPEMMRHGVTAAGLPPVDFYAWPRLRAVMRGLTQPLLPGSLEYPWWSDTTAPAHLSALLAHWIAARLPSEEHFRLAEASLRLPPVPPPGLLATFWHGSYIPEAPLFFAPARGERALTARAAGATTQAAAPKPGAPTDFVYPVTGLGYLRSPERRSCLVLQAAPWGGHRHADSLNLTYHVDGCELLSDLGYLWDGPVREKVTRTLAHHTVMVDGKEQRTRGRAGRFHLFHRLGPVKVVQAEASVYDDATEYVRTLLAVESPAGEYVLDVFRSAGGTRHDWVAHGPNEKGRLYEPDSTERCPVPSQGERAGETPPGAADLPAAVSAELSPIAVRRWTRDEGCWAMGWPVAGERVRSFWLVAPRQEERLAWGRGWGTRDHLAAPGAVLDYLIRSRTGAGPHRFVTLWHASGAAPDPALPPLLIRAEETGDALMIRVASAGGPEAWEDLFILSDRAGAPPVTGGGHALGLAVRGAGSLAFCRCVRRSTGDEEVVAAGLLGAGSLVWPGGSLEGAADVYLSVRGVTVTAAGCFLDVAAGDEARRTLERTAGAGHLEVEFADGTRRLYPLVAVTGGSGPGGAGGPGGPSGASGAQGAAGPGVRGDAKDALRLWTRMECDGFDVVTDETPVVVHVRDVRVFTGGGGAPRADQR